MSKLKLAGFNRDQIHELEAIAAEKGQPVEQFVASVLEKIMRQHRADIRKGLGTRIAKRFVGIGLSDDEDFEFHGRKVMEPDFD
ncbi:hypothetical protein [Rhodopirellula europaea]|uniref:hypothetical protein n=1 Tax=Rhodopirellula europaea TaxID=1263866 RepID=UPI003D27F615|tara:strand:- start:10322 stop:10573 length:252 start_codon:yes stop_codon:yes gene_type:complete